jgi:phosphoesterase RecJ-like protein
MMNDWGKATDLLGAAQRVIILTHIAPDGDAIGSMLGLGHALRALGKQVVMAVDDGVPGALRFLPGADAIRATVDGVQADLVIATDCGDEKRTGKAGEQARRLSVCWINLDHHRTNTGFADANIMDPAFVSAAECVLRWLDYMNVALTPEVAQCLMCGVVTDTMCFRIDAVTSETFHIAQRLMAAGANLTLIVQNTVSRMATSTLKLWAQVMPTVQIDDHIVWARISLAARQQSGYTDSSDGGLVSLLLQADDAYVSCILREKEEKEVDVRFRAVPGFDVASVAAELGGGGHTLASGATLACTVDEAEARVLPLLKAAVRAGSPEYA